MALIDAHMPVYAVAGMHELPIPASCDAVLPYSERLDFCGLIRMKILRGLRNAATA